MTMTKFFGTFAKMVGQKNFFLENPLCHAQLHMGFWQYAKIQKN